jgi:4-hydroxybenzoate polyprenyltransferase
VIYSIFNEYIKVFRIHQWLKNFLIFIPFILSDKEFNIVILQKLLLGFLSFSLIASSLYILNDLLDLRFDRKHHIKKFRPIASGNIRARYAFFTAILLILISISLLTNLINEVTNQENNFLLILIFYFLLGLFYSLIIKKIIIFDISTLAIFYLIRLKIGGVIVGIELSFWLICFSFFLFFSLAALKRVIEISNNKKSKKVIFGRGYCIIDKSFLQLIGIITGLISILIFALYLNSETITNLYKTPKWLLVNIFLYFFWVIYIWFKANRNEVDEDIIKFFFKNTLSIFLLFLFILFFILSKY